MSEQNKADAVDFYKKCLVERDVETAFRLYAGPTYRQHNPLVEDGEAGVRKLAAWVGENRPNATLEIKRVLADGDYVVLHVYWTGLFAASGEAVVDIFRFEDGKIVEHWDVIQPIPENSVHANTMF